MRNVGYLAEEVARLYVAEISLALEYLHCTLGVVHRDLKPDNVLIDQQGHIKLTDFGLSVFGLAPGDDAYDGDEPQAKVGTPDYMSPEVLLGETHGPPVDLWALGCLSFELLTGYTPFTGESVEEVFENILEHTRGDAVRWPEEEEHLSEQAFNLVTRLLEPVQEHRLGPPAASTSCARRPSSTKSTGRGCARARRWCRSSPIWPVTRTCPTSPRRNRCRSTRAVA